MQKSIEISNIFFHSKVSNKSWMPRHFGACRQVLVLNCLVSCHNEQALTLTSELECPIPWNCSSGRYASTKWCSSYVSVPILTHSSRSIRHEAAVRRIQQFIFVASWLVSVLCFYQIKTIPNSMHYWSFPGIHYKPILRTLYLRSCMFINTVSPLVHSQIPTWPLFLYKNSRHVDRWPVC